MGEPRGSAPAPEAQVQTVERKPGVDEGRCLSCRFFENDPAQIEEIFPGLNVLTSAYASVRADAGICCRHDLFLSPWKTCRDFQPRQP